MENTLSIQLYPLRSPSTSLLEPHQILKSCGSYLLPTTTYSADDIQPLKVAGKTSPKQSEEPRHASRTMLDIQLTPFSKDLDISPNAEAIGSNINRELLHAALEAHVFSCCVINANKENIEIIPNTRIPSASCIGKIKQFLKLDIKSLAYLGKESMDMD